MSHLIGREAPDFTAAAVMKDNRIESEFSLSSLRGAYTVLLFYPLDFTFVCPSEILAFNEMLHEFTARNTSVVGVSVDSVNTHLAWKQTPLEKGGIGPVGFPLVSDLERNIADAYGVLLDDGTALRALFLIDRGGIVRHAVLNDTSLGRSVTETLRMVDALRFHEERGHLCPADWQKGEEGIIPSAQGTFDYLSRFARRKMHKE